MIVLSGFSTEEIMSIWGNEFNHGETFRNPGLRSRAWPKPVPPAPKVKGVPMIGMFIDFPCSSPAEADKGDKANKAD